MGIRVDEESSERQLKISGLEERKAFPFHQMVLNKELPYSIGGGIGQSRFVCFSWKKFISEKCKLHLGRKKFVRNVKKNIILL